MLKLVVSGLMEELRAAVANPEMGVEKEGEFIIHESLAEQYLGSVLQGAEKALRDKLGLAKPAPPAPEEPAKEAPEGKPGPGKPRAADPPKR
jgi:hypothetical protein